MRRTAFILAQASLAGGVIAIALIATFTLLEVISRSFLNQPLPWVADLSAYALCFGISMSLPYATRKGLQIAVTMLPEMLSRQSARALWRTMETLAGLACLVIAALCVDVGLKQYSSGVATVATVTAQKWIFSLMLAYGFLFGGIMHLLNAVWPDGDVNPTFGEQR